MNPKDFSDKEIRIHLENLKRIRAREQLEQVRLEHTDLPELMRYLVTVDTGSPAKGERAANLIYASRLERQQTGR